MPAKEQRTTIGTTAGYDQSLITKAPEITKADRQEGYDINLVEQGRKTPLPPPSRPRTVAPSVVPPRSGSRSSHEKSSIPPLPVHVYSNDVTKLRPIPWYRTAKGIAIIVVAALVLVGVVVGVAVGVTQNNKASAAYSSSAVQHPTGNTGQTIAESNAGGLAPTSATVPVATSSNAVPVATSSNAVPVATSSNAAAVSTGVPGSSSNNANGNGNAPNGR